MTGSKIKRERKNIWQTLMYMQIFFAFRLPCADEKESKREGKKLNWNKTKWNENTNTSKKCCRIFFSSSFIKFEINMNNSVRYAVWMNKTATKLCCKHLTMGYYEQQLQVQICIWKMFANEFIICGLFSVFCILFPIYDQKQSADATNWNKC